MYSGLVGGGTTRHRVRSGDIAPDRWPFRAAHGSTIVCGVVARSVGSTFILPGIEGEDEERSVAMPSPDSSIPAGIVAAGAVAILSVVVVTSPTLSSSVLLPVVVPAFVLFVPGYAVIVCLYPLGRSESRARGDGPGFEGSSLLLFRAVASLALSVAVAGFLGLGLYFAGVAISKETVAGGLFAVTVVGLAVGSARQAGRPSTESAPQRDTRALEGVVGELRSGPLTSRLVPVVVTLAVLASIVLVASAVHAPNETEQYTELSIRTPNASGELVAGGFPDRASGSSTQPVVVDVQNREHEPATFTVVLVEQRLQRDQGVLRVVDQVERDRFSISLDRSESWSKRLRVAPTYDADSVRFAFLLYRSDPPDSVGLESAFREVHFWTNASETTASETSTSESGSSSNVDGPSSDRNGSSSNDSGSLSIDRFDVVFDRPSPPIAPADIVSPSARAPTPGVSPAPLGQRTERISAS